MLRTEKNSLRNIYVPIHKTSDIHVTIPAKKNNELPEFVFNHTLSRNNSNTNLQYKS